MTAASPSRESVCGSHIISVSPGPSGDTLPNASRPRLAFPAASLSLPQVLPAALLLLLRVHLPSSPRLSRNLSVVFPGRAAPRPPVRAPAETGVGHNLSRWDGVCVCVCCSEPLKRLHQIGSKVNRAVRPGSKLLNSHSPPWTIRKTGGGVNRGHRAARRLAQSPACSSFSSRMFMLMHFHLSMNSLGICRLLHYFRLCSS